MPIRERKPGVCMCWRKVQKYEITEGNTEAQK